MSIRLTIICENSVGRPARVIGEHGFACFIETPEGNYLFDTGQGLGIIHNAQVLDKDLASVKGIILSHGHYDHAGGLDAVLRVTGSVDVFAHPQIFRPRYSVDSDARRYVGIPFCREHLEALGARFRLSRDFQPIAPGICLSGEIPRTNDFEKGDPHLVVPIAESLDFVPDPFVDDYSLVLDTAKGLVLILGCAHSGLVNVMEHACEQTGKDQIYAVIGGTHLGPASEEQFAKTVQALKDFRVGRIGVSHCTGQLRAARLQAEFGKRFFFACVGASLEI